MYLSYLQMELKHDLYNIDDSQKLKQASYCLTAYLASSDGFNMLSGPWLPINHSDWSINLHTVHKIYAT